MIKEPCLRKWNLSSHIEFSVWSMWHKFLYFFSFAKHPQFPPYTIVVCFLPLVGTIWGLFTQVFPDLAHLHYMYQAVCPRKYVFCRQQCSWSTNFLNLIVKHFSLLDHVYFRVDRYIWHWTCSYENFKKGLMGGKDALRGFWP